MTFPGCRSVYRASAIGYTAGLPGFEALGVGDAVGVGDTVGVGDAVGVGDTAGGSGIFGLTGTKTYVSVFLSICFWISSIPKELASTDRPLVAAGLSERSDTARK